MIQTREDSKPKQYRNVLQYGTLIFSWTEVVKFFNNIRRNKLGSPCTCMVVSF